MTTPGEWADMVNGLLEEKKELLRLNGDSLKTIRDMKAALQAAQEWMEQDGCDCGTDEPGSCALCLTKEALRLRLRPASEKRQEPSPKKCDHGCLMVVHKCESCGETIEFV